MIQQKVFGLFILLLPGIILSGCGEDDGKGTNTIEEDPVTYDYVVAQDGSGDFATVQEVLDAIPFLKEERTYVYIKNGVYKEVITLEKKKNNVTLIGEDAEKVVLTYNNYASKVNEDTGEKYGTSGSASSYWHGDSFYARNITFQNSSGPVGQALAVYISGDKAVFENCRFLGYQDTMYGGRSRQYFGNCYIEGSTDFIFGPATAWFENCDLYTKGGSAITAASTESYVNYGYVFNNCKITGEGEGITTLGRPWRPYAAVVFLNSEMSDAIKPAGWDNWGNTDNEKTVRYAEYANTGEGADKFGRVDWVSYLTETEAAGYTITNVFKTTYTEPVIVDNWSPDMVLDEVNTFLERVE